MTENLIKQKTLQEFLNAREILKNKILEVEKLKFEINQISEAFLNDEYLFSDLERKGSFEWKKFQKYFDYKFWFTVLRESKITQVMTEKAKDNFLSNIEKNTPEFILKEVEALGQNIKRIYVENQQQTIMEVYKTLIGCHYNSSNWQVKKKDNLQGVKNIFRCSGNIWYSWGSFSLSQSHGNSLCFQDFYTACKLLDGKGWSDYSDTFESKFYDQQRRCNGQLTIDTDYFTVVCYKNSNQLVKWKKDKDYIRERLNQIGGGKGLPDSMKKRYKREHFNCEL